MKMNKLFFATTFLLILLNKAFSFDLKNFPSIHGHKGSSQDIIIFGGSFNPPTKGHLKILIKTMRERNLRKAIILVDYPYKKTSWPKEIPLYLTRLMIENLDQYFTEEQIQFTNFRSHSFGHISWLENGKHYEIKVSGQSIKDQGEHIPLENFKKIIQEERVNPKNVWAIFGADSLMTIHKWEQGLDWFKQMNFIVYNRGIDKDNLAFDFLESSPLKRSVDPTLNLDTPIFKDESLAIYKPHERETVVVIFRETGGNISSTHIRDHIKAGKGHLVKMLLLPRIFQEIDKFCLYRTEEDFLKKEKNHMLINFRPNARVILWPKKVRVI